MLMFIEVLFPVNNVYLWLSIQKFVCNGHLIMADQTADGQLDESYHMISSSKDPGLPFDTTTGVVSAATIGTNVFSSP